MKKFEFVVEVSVPNKSPWSGKEMTESDVKNILEYIVRCGDSFTTTSIREDGTNTERVCIANKTRIKIK